MKIILLIVLGFFIGFLYGNINLMVNNHTVRTSTSIDLTAGHFSEKVEIGCHSQFPMRKECIESIAQPRCRSDRVPERVTYAWQKWRDIDFILTVADESMFDQNAVGDQGRAFGFCQIRGDMNKWGYDRYKAMDTWQERLGECYRMYKVWKDKGIVHKRLYGYNRRYANKLHISCQ